MTSAQYEAFFKETDTDGSGYLTLDELLASLKKRGYKGADGDIRKMFRDIETSGDNKVSLEEYLVGMGQMPEKDHKGAMMRRLFNEFDKDGSGCISHDELKQVFKELGKDMSDKDLKRMIELGDKDGNDSLDYEEFIKQVFG